MKMIILRGLPGSGKSTYARTLGIERIYSTDDFFVGEDGVYRFDPAKIAEAHLWNQQRVRAALAQGHDVVTILYE